MPDFIARARPTDVQRAGATVTVVPHLIVEGKGPLDERAADKARWTTEWWVPSANHATRVEGGPQAHWGYLEIRTLDDIDRQIDGAIERAAQTP